jgi:hypothetical protein
MENKQAIAHALLKAEFIILPFKTIIVLSEASEAWPAAVWSIAKVISIEERICDAPHRQQLQCATPVLSKISAAHAKASHDAADKRIFEKTRQSRRSHRALRRALPRSRRSRTAQTLAMVLGLADHAWTISELLEHCLATFRAILARFMEHDASFA